MLHRFVPESKPPSLKLIEELQRMLDNANSLIVMTGAGVSTESGIPDYRSAKVGQYARTKHRPIQHMEFMTNEFLRRRYWARNFLAYNTFSRAVPNLNHKILAEWEKTSSRFNSLITQNVDGLHLR
jgi:NAD-dependent deacetylase sirtuin 4